MITHYKVMLWHNKIGWLVKPSLPSEIRQPYYYWDLDTNLLRTRGNSAANQRSHIVPGKSDVQASLILTDIQSSLATCPNNLQSTYQLGMSDFRDVVEFRASAVAPVRRPRARGRNFKLQLQSSAPESNLSGTPIEENKVAGGYSGRKFAHFKTNL